MAIDVSKITYEVELLNEAGASYDLSQLVISLSWEHQAEELAIRAAVTLHNFKINQNFLSSLAKLNCKVNIYSNWGFGRKIVFSGFIWGASIRRIKDCC